MVLQGVIAYIANITTGGELPKATTTDLDAARLFRYLEITGTPTAVIQGFVHVVKMIKGHRGRYNRAVHAKTFNELLWSNKMRRQCLNKFIAHYIP